MQSRWLKGILAGFTLSLFLFRLDPLSPGARPAQAINGILYVASTGDCNGFTPCYVSVQSAVDAAADNDVIKVATGIYTDINNYAGLAQLVYITKTITVRGGYAPNFGEPPNPGLYPTILDAQGQGRVLYITGGVSSTIEGFDIRNGDATGLGGGFFPWANAGGGIYVTGADITLSKTNVYSNTTDWDGGGLFLSFGSGTLSDNLFAHNSSDRLAGGLLLYHSNTVLQNNRIEDNMAGGPGGLLLLVGTYILTSNAIINNDALSGGGGGIFLEQTTAMLQENIITGNTAYGGGGLGTNGGTVTLNHNVISGNTGSYSGGGISAFWGNIILDGNIITGNVTIASSTSPGYGGGIWFDNCFAILTNNLVADNQAGGYGSGMYISDSAAQLIHNTLVRNNGGDGSGLYLSSIGGVGSNVTLTNTILADQTVGITVTTGSTANVSNILLFGNGIDYGGGGVLTITNTYIGDPAFATDGYHLTSLSTAIDLGTGTDVILDIDSDLRPNGKASDLGADEFSGPPLPTGTPTTTATPMRTATPSETPSATPTYTYTPTATHTPISTPLSETLHLPLITR